MPWDAGLAILSVYRILRARKGRRLGGIRGTGTPANHPPTIRRSPAEATPRPGILQKSIPKSRSNLERLLAAKMHPKASQNETKNLLKIIEKSIQFSTEFLVPFCIDVSSFCSRPDPLFCCYLQHFRGVQHFSRTWKVLKKTSKKAPKMMLKSLENRFKNR